MIYDIEMSISSKQAKTRPNQIDTFPVYVLASRMNMWLRGALMLIQWLSWIKRELNNFTKEHMHNATSLPLTI